MDHRAKITLEDVAWSGWDPDGYSIVTSAQIRVAKGKALTAEALGKGGSYEILVEHIVVDRVGFAYRGLVVKNPEGTINLTAPNSGKFILRPGESKKLATPTMDAGTLVSVTLDEII